MARSIFIAAFFFTALFSAGGHRAVHAQAFTLAISWQPAFCQRSQRLPECITQTQDRIDARQFSLHGLWPEPRGNVYCDVPREIVELDRRGAWLSFPPLDLPDALARRLAAAMPGVQSGLDRHEWIKHGTCNTEPSAIAYFEHSLALLGAVNQTNIDDMFFEAVGSYLHTDTIRAAFDLAFGKGAGDRVQLICREDGPRVLVVELRLSLEGPPDAPLADLLEAAAARKKGCVGGIIDAAGFD